MNTPAKATRREWIGLGVIARALEFTAAVSAVLVLAMAAAVVSLLRPATAAA